MQTQYTLALKISAMLTMAHGWIQGYEECGEKVVFCYNMSERYGTT